jgi:hypothetical protein
MHPLISICGRYRYQEVLSCTCHMRFAVRVHARRAFYYSAASRCELGAYCVAKLHGRCDIGIFGNYWLAKFDVIGRTRSWRSTHICNLPHYSKYWLLAKYMYLHVTYMHKVSLRSVYIYRQTMQRQGLTLQNLGSHLHLSISYYEATSQVLPCGLNMSGCRHLRKYTVHTMI